MGTLCLRVAVEDVLFESDAHDAFTRGHHPWCWRTCSAELCSLCSRIHGRKHAQTQCARKQAWHSAICAQGPALHLGLRRFAASAK